MPVSWEIQFWDRDVEYHVDGLDDATKHKVDRLLDFLENLGPALPMPHAKHLGGGLYESRTSGQNAQRLYYAFHGSTIWILNYGGKSSRGGQQRDIDLARRRLDTLR